MSTFRVLLCLLWIAFASTPALADSIGYAINFTATSGSPPTSGSFTYDDAVPTFTNFLITWEGWTYNFTSVANSLSHDSLIASGIRGTVPCVEGLTGAAAAFALLSGECNYPGWRTLWSAGPIGFDTSHFEIFSDGSPVGAISLNLVGGAAHPFLLNAHGPWTITALPEPSVPSLLLTGLCSLALVASSSHHLRPTMRR